MNDYQKFIHISRYARWLEDEGRRETWEETVHRYIDWMMVHTNGGSLSSGEWLELENAITNMDVMPSMRALMTAGPALDANHIAGYNCAYLAVDSIRAFDEAMMILLCGTGVGYSVEHQYTDKLPVISQTINGEQPEIIVADSKEGWAKSLKLLIDYLYEGYTPTWNVSQVRPAGARLKTFGGRASGPGPLVMLLEFVTQTINKARGRKLTSLECHDIMCKIADVVVVGGVRRSAMISLSDLHDESMRMAKSGQWWETASHRALANNSAVYDTKPEIGEFMKEWLSLYSSKSGERGVFNRQASQIKAAENGRRDPDYTFGTNPCSEIILRPRQFCNLTEVVVRSSDTLKKLENKVRLATILGTFQSTITDFKYLRNSWKQNTEAERLLGVSMTGVLDHSELAYNKKWLNHLKEVAIATNKEFSDALGISQSTAITCVKPSGTVSQLVDSASGCHARHSPYYIRTVRGDIKDPLTQFMIDQGVPCEPDLMNPEATMVFSFPQCSPIGSHLRGEMSAIDALEIWKNLQDYWCEHKPSVTINVKEHEWLDVGAWVYKAFDNVSGISFLPFSDHTYQQAPYQECTKEQYDEAMSKMPKKIDWAKFAAYEQTDNTTGSQEYACAAGFCEIV